MERGDKSVAPLGLQANVPQPTDIALPDALDDVTAVPYARLRWSAA